MSKSDLFNEGDSYPLLRPVRELSKTEHPALGDLYAAREDERRRVARELHDDLSQRIALLSIEATEVMHLIPRGSANLARLCKSLQRQALALARDIREVALEQHPTAPAGVGLKEALRRLVSEHRRRNGATASFRATRAPRQVPDRETNHVFRIVQEAIRNAGKHSGGARVEVKLLGYSDCFQVVVRDFGQGFDPVSRRGHSLGLLNMQDRAKLINGKLTIASRPGLGTWIKLEVPLDTRRGESNEPSHSVDRRRPHASC